MPKGAWCNGKRMGDEVRGEIPALCSPGVRLQPLKPL